MGSAGVDVFGIVVRRDTLLCLGIVGADGRHAILHRNAVRTGVRAKVLIERTVLLHDDDNVLDLVAQQDGLIGCGWIGWRGHMGR